MQGIPDSYSDYIAWEQLPHLWCAGCGHGIILKGIILALGELDIPPHKALLATGIGCSGRAGDYIACHRFQGTHGRTLAFATGIAAAQPDLTIIAFMGDGDAGAIGGNHLIHAARRNINITAVISNNFNYGMTGGQFSPLTPENSITSTSRSGKSESIMDICSIAAEAGANYVAKTTVYHVRELHKFLKEAISTKGFSLVEVISPCPTYYGRYNKIGNSPEMLNWLKETALPLEKFQSLSHEEKQKFFWRGKLVQRSREDFLNKYKKQQSAMK
ncbi:MAG TPA: 2-oxoacid:ferredoxin oxidoreductase subunit beta [Peptococcaceae bacterium]|nr:MAG: 2-oxoacid:ferredoxin oxidoreductase, beta subunit [Clostridia bacterium 41_269]HBT20282.1 2-oxoacid:ferredoxin oxidoreductase subunit beta [Peptococcaceae bacterium]